MTALVLAGGLPALFSAQAAEPLTREGLLVQLKERIDRCKAYQCTMTLESYADGHEVQNQVLWYKRPGYMRIEQTGPFKKGAIVVIRPGESARVKPDGLLSFVTLSMKTDDPRLRGVTGDSAVTAGYDTIIRTALAASPAVTGYTITREARDGQPVMVLESGAQGPVDRYRMIVDERQMVIVKLERYKAGRLLYDITWKDIRLDIELADELFRL